MIPHIGTGARTPPRPSGDAVHVRGVRRLRVRADLIIPLLVIGAAVPPETRACEDLTVRDAAFLYPRDVHRLCVMANAKDPAGHKTYQRLDAWLLNDGKDLNVQLVRVRADRADVSWKEYGIPSAPPSLPVVVLAGRRTAERRFFFIHHWNPAPSAEDLERLETSPVRQALQRELGRRLAVLLYLPRTSGGASVPDDGSAARSRPVGASGLLQTVVDTWSARVSQGLALVRVDRSDLREQVLLSFIGVGPTGPDWVAVVFGRGKFMPPLVGDQITEAGLGEQLEILLGGCTCLRSPVTLGVDLPMRWDEALDQEVVPVGPGLGIRALRPEASVVAASDAAGSGRRILATTLGTSAGLLVLVGAAAVVMVWRKRRREARSTPA